MSSPARLVAIQNRHPRLRAPVAQIRRAIAVLDAQFTLVPADRPHLARPARAPIRSTRTKPPFPRAKLPGVCPPGELSLVFLTDPELAQIHADFMDDPTATDVITFEGDAAVGLAGEICVSADTAATYARAQRRDFATELTLYVVHGWLHLAGYDDLRPERKRRMRAAEKRALTLLHTAQAVPPFAWR
ncbi:MAG: rRNA maturation RNase YbeY [Candidatus Didemnitutus sp.]|nr:rRNA maturation RNase YbeY [Candidatus Didemnitutus sp.]